MGATFEWDTVRKSSRTEAMGDILQRNRLVERLSPLPVMADCVVLLFYCSRGCLFTPTRCLFSVGVLLCGVVAAIT